MKSIRKAHTLSLINTHTTIFDERLFGIVEARRAITVSIVRDLMIIPDRNPGKFLVREKQIKIGTVSSESASVIVKSEDLTLRLHRAGGSGRCVLVDVVAEMDDEVDIVLSG